MNDDSPRFQIGSPNVQQDDIYAQEVQYDKGGQLELKKRKVVKTETENIDIEHLTLKIG